MQPPKFIKFVNWLTNLMKFGGSGSNFVTCRNLNLVFNLFVSFGIYYNWMNNSHKGMKDTSVTNEAWTHNLEITRLYLLCHCAQMTLVYCYEILICTSSYISKIFFKNAKKIKNTFQKFITLNYKNIKKKGKKHFWQKFITLHFKHLYSKNVEVTDHLLF